MISFLLSLPTLLKVAALLTLVSVEASLNLGPASSLLQLIAIGLIVVVGFRAGRSKLKDETIKELKDALEARDTRARDLRDEIDRAHQNVRQIEAGAAHLREEVAAGVARYEEQGKYTAESALTAVMTTMQQGESNQERRHHEVMEALAALKLALERP